MSRLFGRALVVAMAIAVFVTAAPSALASNGGPGFP
jgi:hypothetical protein